MAKTKSKKFIDWNVLSRVLDLVKPYRKKYYSAIVLSIIVACLVPLKPYFIGVAVDDHILNFDFNGLQKVIIILFILLIAEAILRYFLIYTTRLLGQTIIKGLRLKIFNHYMRFKLRYFDRTPIGNATTRTITDVERINDIFAQGLINIVTDLLVMTAVLIVMFYHSWRLTLVCIIPFPLIIYFTYIFKEKMKGAFRIVRESVSKLNSFVQEHVTGMSVVQVFNAEKQEKLKFEKINAEHRDANVKTVLYFSIFIPLIEITLSISLGLLVWFGAKGVVSEWATLGVFVAFPLYLNLLFRPMRQLADRFNTLQNGMVASERVFDVLDLTESIPNQGIINPSKIKGAIDFHNVSFAYDDKNFVLNDISFSVNAGETLAIVGATGSGKTSIINLLNRFYQINSGLIKVDDKPVEEYSLEGLRSNIGMVLQDVFLFSGSIKENINLRDENITDEQVYNAAKLVGAYDFIMKLPGGFEYDVMERGATLSMGQRQIISFIRALVYNPSILILDEATSSIDTESEELIQSAIEKLIKGRTSVIIAHRLSTIQHADKILVLDAGKIVEQGSHEELLAIDGFYKRLHDMQFKPKKTA